MIQTSHALIDKRERLSIEISLQRMFLSPILQFDKMSSGITLVPTELRNVNLKDSDNQAWLATSYISQNSPYISVTYATPNCCVTAVHSHHVPNG